MMLEQYTLHFNQAVVLFALYSFIGWIIETAYRSITQRRLVNAGFLIGPFTPIYGIGAALVIIISLLANGLSFPVKVFAFAVITTLLELIIGYTVEKIFGFKLWDYTDNAWNFKGIICPKYSAIWTALSLIFIYYLHPTAYGVVERLKHENLYMLATSILVYFAVDATLSLMALAKLKKSFAQVFHEYLELSNSEIQHMLDSFKRILRAFPDLNRHIEINLRQELKDRLNELIAAMNGKISKFKMKPADDIEFIEIFNEIAANEEYQCLKNYYHHSSSIYDHTIEVAYFSYRMSKYLKLDYRSATRGALLHDFFCYDWRNHDLPDLAPDKYHGVEHPKIALANSEKNFKLNDIERDIIIKHMWPITTQPPKYKESYVVNFADKFIASKEYSVKIKHFAQKRIAEVKKASQNIKKIRIKKIKLKNIKVKKLKLRKFKIKGIKIKKSKIRHGKKKN